MTFIFSFDDAPSIAEIDRFVLKSRQVDESNRIQILTRYNHME